jgi:hypothetical protein
VVRITEGDMASAIYLRALARPGVVEEPGMCASSLGGNGEVSGSRRNQVHKDPLSAQLRALMAAIPVTAIRRR